MTGRFANRHAVLPVTLRPPGQLTLNIDFVIDTGFTDFLTLPPAAVAALGLPFLFTVPADLADDSTIDLAVHSASIVWNGTAQDVRVLSTGRRPLLGTALLDGQELVAQFTDGGLVTIDDL